ncbi:MAG TPA: STAS/SEC14 domain-containing protein [Acidimicrobiales bacterium]|nr:STAS/SEC14 domain-containing protein [Acidimicrobiales bacterium]
MTREAVMFELIPALPDNVVGVVAKGEVTKDDYEQRLVPAVEDALTRHDKIRLLYVLGADFTGFTGGAAWEDGKLGLGHIGSWERVAVVAREAWVRHAVNLFGYLIPGEVKVYDLADEADASAWITS